jgi:hypothetical protein
MIDYQAVHAVADNMMQYANSMSSGYIKHWKAHSMCVTVVDLISADADMTVPRLFKYVCNCLEMEGFTREACVDITLYLERNLLCLATQQVDTTEFA